MADWASLPPQPPYPLPYGTPDPGKGKPNWKKGAWSPGCPEAALPPPEIKAMVVLQADGSVMAGAGGWEGREGGRMQAPYIRSSTQPPPEQTFLLPTHPTRPEAQSSHPCPAAPHSLRAPL